MIFENNEAKNLYQVLGVSPSVPQRDLQEIVIRLRKIFDPSTYPQGLPGLQALARSRLEEIERAFLILGDPISRQAYDEELNLPANVIPLMARRSPDRVLNRSVASVGEELLSQDPSLHWKRSHVPGFHLVATAEQDEEVYQVRFRIVPRLTIEDLREFLFTVQDLLTRADLSPRREHLTFLLAAEILEDQEEVYQLLRSFHEESWGPLDEQGARARVFVLQGPSGNILAPGGVAQDRPALNPRRLLDLDRKELRAA
jgi:hypothetical protein